MLSSLNSFLSSGVNKWFHPKPLMEAINGCLRIVAEPLCGSEYLTSPTFLPYGRATSGTVSIPLSKIFQEFGLYAGDGVSADASVLAGERRDGWRVWGLPKRLVALGKSPDDCGMALVGNDFTEDDKGYVFKENPIKFGSVTSTKDGEILSFYYLGGAVTIRDFPQFKHTLGVAETKAELEFITSLKSTASVVNGASGRTNPVITGGFACSVDSVIDNVWIEGDLKVGITRAGQLLYADKRSETKQPGDVILSGEVLGERGYDIGVIAIHNGVANWLRGGTEYNGEVKSHSETVISSYTENVPLNRHIKMYRPNTGNDTIVQHIKADSKSVQETNPTADPKIKSIWALYKNSSDSGTPYKSFNGMTTKDLKKLGIERGGCLEITKLTETVGEDNTKAIEAVGLNAKAYGKQMEPGDVIYAVSAVTDDDRVYKTVSIKSGGVLRAQATPILCLSVNSTDNIVDPEVSTSTDRLTNYWLLVEQGLDVTGAMDVPEKEII